MKSSAIILALSLLVSEHSVSAFFGFFSKPPFSIDKMIEFQTKITRDPEVIKKYATMHNRRLNNYKEKCPDVKRDKKGNPTGPISVNTRLKVAKGEYGKLNQNHEVVYAPTSKTENLNVITYTYLLNYGICGSVEVEMKAKPRPPPGWRFWQHFTKPEPWVFDWNPPQYLSPLDGVAWSTLTRDANSFEYLDLKDIQKKLTVSGAWQRVREGNEKFKKGDPILNTFESVSLAINNRPAIPIYTFDLNPKHSAIVEIVEPDTRRVHFVDLEDETQQSFRAQQAPQGQKD